MSASAGNLGGELSWFTVKQCKPIVLSALLCLYLGSATAISIFTSTSPPDRQSDLQKGSLHSPRAWCFEDAVVQTRFLAPQLPWASGRMSWDAGTLGRAPLLVSQLA